MAGPAWKERMGHYRTEEGAAAYQGKHRRSLMRRLAPLESLLDCPCGAGRFLPRLASHGADVFGVDQSLPLILLARQERPSARFAVGDAGALPFPDRSVDAVVCMRLLHHFGDREDRVRMLAEAARVAAKGVVVSFADADTWKGRRTSSRRRPIARSRLREEAARAGLVLDPGVLPIHGFFSAFSFALLRIRES
jgi:ubiquinone/menaquinone biosynthesis C-methylase UbiE